jgi:hypothetical protein
MRTRIDIFLSFGKIDLYTIVHRSKESPTHLQRQITTKKEKSNEGYMVEEKQKQTNTAAVFRLFFLSRVGQRQVCGPSDTDGRYKWL